MRSNPTLPNTVSPLIPTLICSLVLSSFNGALGQEGTEGTTNQTLFTIAVAPPGSLTPVSSPDTSSLQSGLLMEIDEALSRGSIAADEASNLKERLDNLSNTESWYKSMNLPIPSSLVQQDIHLLNQWSLTLEKKLPQEPAVSTTDALHLDIDELISTALAGNKITSTQAEKYYLRLSQIESSLEKLKGDPVQFHSETAALNQNLRELKTEVHNVSRSTLTQNNGLGKITQ